MVQRVVYEKLGWNLSEREAEAIATALFGAEGAGEKFTHRIRVERAVWESEGYQKWVASVAVPSMYTQLHKEWPDYIPHTLPEMRLHYYDKLHLNNEIPDVLVKSGAPWDFVEVEWTMYIRRAR